MPVGHEVIATIFAMIDPSLSKKTRKASGENNKTQENSP
jgi:hypothetical protein